MPTARHILRWSHRILLASHLTLLAAILILWPLSYQKCVALSIDPPTDGLAIGILTGRIFLNYPEFEGRHIGRHLRFNQFPATPSVVGSEWTYLAQHPDPPDSYRVMCFGTSFFYTSSHPSIPNSLAIPFSYLTLLLLIYPALTYRHHKKTRHLHPTRAFPLDPPTLSPPQD